MTEERRQAIEAEYQRWKEAGVGLAVLAEFRRREKLGEDLWLTRALAEQAARMHPPLRHSGVTLGLPAPAPRPQRSRHRKKRPLSIRRIDPSELYYSDLGGED